MKERIEYIDALRGFTMLLVVYSHVRLYGYHVDDSNTICSFNSIFILIRMPLFFFISGFLFYKKNWEKTNMINCIKRKAKIQIFSALIFMLIYAFIFNYNFFEGLFDYYKLGYWFTLNTIIPQFKSTDYIKDYILIASAIIIHFATTNKCLHLIGLNENINHILGITLFKYYIFFVLGVITRKHFQAFLRKANNNILLTILIISFFIPLIPIIKFNLSSINVWINHFTFLYFGILGIYIIFLYFNKYQSFFSKEKRAGIILQFIGKRTLEIYLLHYYFIPRNIEWLGEYFTNFKNPSIELFASLTISWIVIGLCLVVSSIIRLSPILSFNLFGSIQENENSIYH